MEKRGVGEGKKDGGVTRNYGTAKKPRVKRASPARFSGGIREYSLYNAS